MLHDLNHWLMLDRVKGFCEVQFQQTTSTPRSLALMYIFECPAQTVLDRPSLEETVLIMMDNPKDNTLETVANNFVIILRQQFKSVMGM